MQPLFTAIEPFGPEDGTAWEMYLDWAKLKQLKRVVSLDHMLCPSLLRERVGADWEHLETFDGLDRDLFRDFEYVKSRVPPGAPHHLLCVFYNPKSEADLRAPAGFDYLGCDLIESGGGVSSLVNCGGFEGVFENEELSEYGLLRSLQRAQQVQRDMPEKFPDEIHAFCEIFAIFWISKTGLPSAPTD
jgi:hypothetical protein